VVTSERKLGMEGRASSLPSKTIAAVIEGLEVTTGILLVTGLAVVAAWQATFGNDISNKLLRTEMKYTDGCTYWGMSLTVSIPSSDS
jgi:hypothetical protein